MGIMDDLENDLYEIKGRTEQKYDDTREGFREELQDHHQKRRHDDLLDHPEDNSDHQIL